MQIFFLVSFICNGKVEIFMTVRYVKSKCIFHFDISPGQEDPPL